MRRLGLSLGIVAMLVAVLASAGTVYAYDFPSTNDENRDAGFPHVNFVSNDVGEVTLEFVNDTNSLASFEYRIDGQELTTGTPHPVVTGEFIYPNIDVESTGISEPVIVTETFSATSAVEIRLALGGERDWDFNWVTFNVPGKEACMNGGYADFGFANQGLCIQFLNTGSDSR